METRFVRPKRRIRILPPDWQARLPLKSVLYGFITVLLMCIVFAAFMSRESAFDSAEMAELRVRGVLRVGVDADLPGLHSDGAGLCVDIANLLAQEIFGEAAAVELVPVTRQNVRAVLTDGKIDIALLSISGISASAYESGLAYYADTCRIYSYTYPLPSEPIIGVLQKSDAEALLIKYEESNAPEIIVAPCGGFDDMRVKLSGGTVNALCLPQLVKNNFGGAALSPVGDPIGSINYRSVALKSNKWLLAALDELIIRWIQDGTLAELYRQNGL